MYIYIYIKYKITWINHVEYKRMASSRFVRSHPKNNTVARFLVFLIVNLFLLFFPTDWQIRQRVGSGHVTDYFFILKLVNRFSLSIFSLFDRSRLNEKTIHFNRMSSTPPQNKTDVQVRRSIGCEILTLWF